jgi:hypothetical protein
MRTYVFYPCRSDGSALLYEAHDCADDAEALLRAESVLLAQVSATEIAVWEGDRHVGRRGQERAP